MIKGSVKYLIGVICELCLVVFSGVIYDGPSLFFFGELPVPEEK